MIKKLFSGALLMLVMLVISQRSFATVNSDLFAFDESAIENTFEPLNALEKVLMDNPSADYNFVSQNFAQAIAQVDFAAATSLPTLPAPMDDRPALGIPGWVWGLCLGGIGILAVYLILDDASSEFRKKQTIQAVIGCGGLVVLYVAAAFLFWGGSFWYWY